MRYTYRYVATSVTGVAGISKETKGHRIEAKCYVEGLGDCKSVLKVCLFLIMKGVWRGVIDRRHQQMLCRLSEISSVVRKREREEKSGKRPSNNKQILARWSGNKTTKNN